MSLIGAMHTSFVGLQNTETRLSVTSANVTNADKPGYTRKNYENEYQTTNLGTLPAGGQINSVALDPYLQKAVVEDISQTAQSNVESEYLSNYSAQTGTVDGQNSISASLDELAASFDELSVTPEDASLKTQVVSDAENLAYDLRTQSNTVQDLRTQADQEIADSVSQINQSLEKLHILNEEIALADVSNKSAADLEDERRTELERLAEEVEIDYFIDSQNRLNIYLGGRPLLNSHAHTLSYAPTTQVNSSVTYPGGFSGIDLNGTDVTSSINGGTLGGLLNLRDVTLVEEQAKLDEFANVLIEETNQLLNQGASIPPRADMIGDEEGFTGATNLGATGFVRIAITDNNGTVINYNDFDLSAYATVGDLLADINTAFGPDVTASLNSNGSLQLISNVVGQGISLNELDSNFAPDGDGFSDFFGLNNLFDGNGAEDIQVSSYLSDNSEYLATSRLSADPALVAGDIGVNVGDGSLVKELNEAFTATYSFDAAGNFVAQNNTLDTYVDNIIADISVRASNASSTAEADALLLEQTQTTLINLTGVNIDEEMTMLIDLEAKYDASATLIATIQQMFDELIAAVR